MKASATKSRDDRVQDLFRKFAFLAGSKRQILRGRLPLEMKREIATFVESCRQLKDSDYGFLRQHINAGQNAFQVSVPASELEASWTFPYLIALGEHYLTRTNEVDLPGLRRRVSLRKVEGHFDLYDFWVNFSYMGDSNPRHNHKGMMSGVIYFQNTPSQSTVFENGVRFAGTAGDILIFPAALRHSVAKKKSSDERITLSFNLNFSLQSEK